MAMTQLKEEAGSMMFEYAEEIERLADIKVAGVGGAGGNAVGRMIEAGLTGVEFLAVNTDLQALKESPAHNPMQIGAQLTKGLGSGGDPVRGREAAEEDREPIAAALAGADMVFVTAGMGGGTGTGAAPVIAGIARDQGALTVGIVTKPFAFEGSVRMAQAERGIDELKDAVDTLIIIPNQRLLEVVPPNTSMAEAFRIADNVLYEATRGIYEIISRHDHVNLDFADVRTVMKGMGEAMMGTGRAEGENRAVEAGGEPRRRGSQGRHQLAAARERGHRRQPRGPGQRAGQGGRAAGHRGRHAVHPGRGRCRRPRHLRLRQ